MSEMSKKLQEQNTEALMFYEENLRRESESVSEDVKATCAEIESYKYEAEGLRTKLNGLNLELLDLKVKMPLQSVNNFLSSTTIEDDFLNFCQEAHRLGFKYVADLAKKGLPTVPM
ncbi:hypothetical protein ACH5RR_040630 [Cinchona calisaya]|uniref:Uncharacterized protein n=1 Tax=Cinchona calisaya TaxID=153742 RepID=A0ABD2XWN4_9GENT